LGLAFKADVGDLRQSPAVEVVRRLAAKYGDRVVVVEPYAPDLPPALAQLGARLAALEEALAEADVVALLVNHRPFSAVEARSLEGKAVIDTRGIWR